MAFQLWTSFWFLQKRELIDVDPLSNRKEPQQPHPFHQLVHLSDTETTSGGHAFSKGGKSRFEHLKVNETPVVRSVDGKFVLKILGTLRTFSSLQWCEFSAESGGILESESHDSVSLENLTLFSGKLIVVSGTEIRELNSGETL